MRQNHHPQPDDRGSGARPAYQGAPANALPLTASEDRQWATMAHFGGILGFIPALVIFLVFRDRGPFTAQESKEALNFTLPPTIVALVAWLLSFIPVIGWVFAILNALLWVIIAVSSVVAGIEVNRGRPYRYRLNLRRIP
ncbi:DUF4870 domain-containing protein [Arthrobacter sp. zg-Y820]|uniref:DUF4870 domain-containing protein n=1 Tax=unclassified Arthrobacter TaxID=235627 RepID=UPI00253F90F7|nr:MULTISPECIES: DUF4870 domain-containing protein [unclassified Arthrobacter]MCC9196476.1 DUF4870 domain-containing protein [Arthrobacter sp. zg-Y820]MDK1279338.1 DUF4870 domain-containing protein [Arthrobacter sp. zg.Y820]WIB11142.1 DUF4870 domain-containing protein [Arthrobacter sp. zg-Y820]